MSVGTPDDVLASLDPEQREIAETLRGPVAVLAGAGTGKTRAITHRIAYGVRTGVYDPGRVLALTFTRKAAGELQARLRGLGAEGVRAQTFHAAALAQLGHFWPAFVGGSAPDVLGGKVPSVVQAAESIGIRLMGEAARDVASEIEWRKTSMLDVDAYAGIVDERPLPLGVTGEQLVELHRGYAGLLEDRRQIDFEDVLVLLGGMLEVEPAAAMQVRERYRFFTVDEYQDVSPLQHSLLRLWLGERDDLCVVGDASQTIYSFAGASSSFLLRFSYEFPAAREIRLERNYRSRAPIVAASNRLMRDRAGALTLSPARAERGAQPSFEWFADEQSEAEAVAESIAAQIAQGTAASEIAVLYRMNAQSARFEEALQRRGVAVRVHGAQRFFDRADVKQAIVLLRGEAKVGDARPLFQTVSDAMRAIGWSSRQPEGRAERERWEALNAIVSMVDTMPEGTGIAQFAAELQTRQQSGHEPTVEAVTLSAIHAAKGLEWSMVHVVGMSEGLLPIRYALTGGDDGERALEEERRLCYVAFTRARDLLRLSGVAGGARAAQAPSRFIAEAGLGHHCSAQPQSR